MTRLVIDARLLGHSGIGTYLCEMLPRIVPRLDQWKPVLLARRDCIDGLRRMAGNGAQVHRWDVAPLSISDLWHSPPLVGMRDLLWTPHFNVPLRGRCALAVTLHDILPVTAPSLAGRGRSLPVRAWLRAIERRAHAIFCVSQFTRSELLAHAAVDPAIVHVTSLGVDKAWLAAGCRRGEAHPTMIFVGLLKPHKNVRRLLRAFSRVRERIPHRLVLVARHHDLRNIDRAALSLARSMADRVELVQDVPFAELVARVASAQFAVQPSLHEGFGLPAVEAMAAGVPVLASRAGAMPEVCGDAALYCDPESEDDIARALLLLADDAELRSRLARAGRNRALSFSWDACASATVPALVDALRALRDRAS